MNPRDPAAKSKIRIASQRIVLRLRGARPVGDDAVEGKVIRENSPSGYQVEEPFFV